MECCGGLKVKAMLKNNAVKSERRFLSMVGRYVDEYRTQSIEGAPHHRSFSSGAYHCCLSE